MWRNSSVYILGTKVGDPEECESIDKIFTKNRQTPLLIGSVKSCVGHAESVSGCISVVKVNYLYIKQLINLRQIFSSAY